MLKDKAYKYIISKDHNCAETALLAISEEYGLDIGPEEMKLVSAFGGGMGCGKLCGEIVENSSRFCGKPAASLWKARKDGLAFFSCLVFVLYYILFVL